MILPFLNFNAILGFLSIIVAVFSYFGYIKSILKDKTRPHFVTWLIWSISTLIIFVIQVLHNAGAGSWAVGITGFLSLTITVLALIKNPRNSINKTDVVCIIITIASILLLILTSNQLYSVLLLTLVNKIGFIPTIKKSYHLPHEESIMAFSLFSLRNILSLLALDSLSLINTVYQITSTIGNIAVVVVCLTRRGVEERREGQGSFNH